MAYHYFLFHKQFYSALNSFYLNFLSTKNLEFINSSNQLKFYSKMKKTLALAAFASLALSCEVHDNNLSSLMKDITEGIKRAGQTLSKHPEIIKNTAVKLLGYEDFLVENDLNVLSNLREFVRKHPEFVALKKDPITVSKSPWVRIEGKDHKKDKEEQEKGRKNQTKSKGYIRFDDLEDDEMFSFPEMKEAIKKILEEIKIEDYMHVNNPLFRKGYIGFEDDEEDSLATLIRLLDDSNEFYQEKGGNGGFRGGKKTIDFGRK